MSETGIIIKKTFCRLCEVNCGLEASVDGDGRLVRLRPDSSHPVTAGFACHKGILAKEVHHDPDRLATPQRRTEHGFVATTWDEVIPQVAGRLSSILEEHGPDSVAVYLGNPSAFNAMGAMAIGMFAASLGSKNLFNAGTQDCANKFAVSEILYGSAEIHPMADLDHAEMLLLIGTNPRISKMSFLSTADPIATLRAVRDRDAQILFVNPLNLDDQSDIGETLTIRPDTDAYFLAALICEIDRAEDLGFDADAILGVKHLERLREFVRDYPAQRVAEIVGIEAARIRQVARDFADASSAAVHVSTGVNMGRQGALAYWLAQMLSLVTGNLDRAGGNILSNRGIQPMRLPSEVSDLRSTKWGGYRPPRGSAPGGLMADMILDSENPIRALVVFAGNPLLSIGGGKRLEKAFESIDLLVSIDFYRNATGELADFVLPAVDWFEREDLNYFVQGVQRVPYLQWTDAVVTPRAERKEDWWILSQILTAMGKPSLLDVPGGDVMAALWNGRLAEAGHSIEALREAEAGVALLGPCGHGNFLASVAAADGFDCCPDALIDTLARAQPIFDDLESERPDELKLITRRTHHMMNSTLQNLKGLKTSSGARTNPLYMNPRDALSRGLRQGQWVVVENSNGRLRAELELDEQLREGVVAMSHGFGHERASGMPVAQAHPGVNVNVLSPSGAGSFDPVSAMSHLTGIRVEVSAA